MTENPFIVAHRGLSARYPENTLLAFEKALELPIDAIEFDLHPTRDGKIVVTHDDKLDRGSSGTGPVRDKTLAELKQLDFGAWKSPEFAGTRIPEFRELLDLVDAKRPELFLCVELKENDPACAKMVLEALRERNRLHNCSIISGHPQMLEFADNFEKDLQIHGFEPRALQGEAKERYLRMIRRIGIWMNDITAEKVEFYHSRNIRIDVWAPDTPEDFERIRALDVDFFTTNAADVITRAAGRC